MTEGKKKSLLDKAIDALTDRDEKAAAEEVEKKLAAEKIKAEAAKAKAAKDVKAKVEAAKDVKTKVEAAEKAKVAAAQKKHQENLTKLRKDQAEKLGVKKAEIEQKRAEVAATKAATVKHVWTNQDTYAELAHKHYGSMKEAYWRLIYEHNKHIIGDHPNHIKTGTEIEIPPLPDELKKK